MTMIMRAARRRTAPLAVGAVLLVAGCGTQRGTDVVTAGASGTAVARTGPTSAPSNFLCPGEHPSATASPKSTVSPVETPPGPPDDHYAENHGFDDPFPLYGQSRCDGLAAVTRIRLALEPLRKHGDFDPGSIRSALVALGYPAGAVEVYGNDFLVTVDKSPVCVEGTLDRDTTRADAFGGYPDHASCDRPTGGH
ncbi:hypothetical protein ABH931_006583 [Streptacidiphilus sp. MAP12-33]|uniref:hypothetical protein n=1 Tax=Streptacidiphilus sp. MAP12-33 TaxID=3156266 RepID=UPI003517E10C